MLFLVYFDAISVFGFELPWAFLQVLPLFTCHSLSCRALHYREWLHSYSLKLYMLKCKCICISFVYNFETLKLCGPFEINCNVICLLHKQVCILCLAIIVWPSVLSKANIFFNYKIVWEIMMLRSISRFFLLSCT